MIYILLCLTWNIPPHFFHGPQLLLSTCGIFLVVLLLSALKDLMAWNAALFNGGSPLFG